MTTLKFTQSIKAPKGEVFRNLSSAMALREWLCDVASIDPRAGGRVYLYWNSGYYAAGQISRIKADELLEFTWRGKDDPDTTRVSIHLQDSDGKTILTLEHAGLGEGDKWAAAAQEIQQGWESGLRNLTHVTEVGPDLRITKKPMLGVFLAQFDPARVKELGVPVEEGVLLGGVVKDMGAEKAGLQKDDVIISMNGIATPDIPSLGVALRGREAGETVKVDYYRGGEKLTTQMELSYRPMPEIPGSGPALAAKLRAEYSQNISSLHSALQGVSDEEASTSPAEGEWSIKEIIAHLIHTERNMRSWIHQLVLEQEQVSDSFVDNLTIHNQATVAAYISLESLMTSLEYEVTETVELVKRLPKEFSAHKGTFWRMGSLMTQIPGHISDHNPQIEAALAVVRKSAE